MRLQDNPYFPQDFGQFVRQMTALWRQAAQQVNQLSEGQAVAHYNAATAAPTTGQWAMGDFIRNAEPAELGTAGSKYVIHGWQCVTAGEPGTWIECRYLTGA